MWSARQQSMLNAMGYSLYVRPGLSVASEKVQVTQASDAVPKPSADSSLFKAIMKVAKGRDISGLAIDVNSLQASPQAKRALWPRLRSILKQ